jgi:cell division protein FtsX
MSGPDDLVIVIGRPAAELAHLPATERVSTIAASPRVNGTTTLYKYGFGMVAVGLVFPLLTLIGTATRLAAARREERFAAFRLVGATPRQVGVIASVEAFVGAAVGTLAGIVIFQPLQPVVARVAVTGARYFPSTVAPASAEYLAVLIGVTAVVAAAAGLGTAASIMRLLGPKAASVTLPGHVYFLTLGCALAVSLAVLLGTLPLLKRITVPDEMRFE